MPDLNFLSIEGEDVAFPSRWSDLRAGFDGYGYRVVAINVSIYGNLLIDIYIFL